VRISAKVDYAVRAVVELAARDTEAPVKVDALAEAQGIPARFLENIMLSLRHAGIVESRRGPEGGFRLAKPAAEIAVADVIRAVDGPLASVGGVRPERLTYGGSAAALPEVWIAVRASLREVLEHVSLADVAAGQLPDCVRARAADPGAWEVH
jgi:Rrf2 family protein